MSGTGAGGELPEWSLDRVDPASMKVLALLLADPNPLHYDLAAARRAGFGERVNQGPANTAFLINMLRAAFPGGRVTRLRVQLRGSVLAGQPVRAGGRIVGREPLDGGESVTCEVHLDGPATCSTATPPSIPTGRRWCSPTSPPATPIWRGVRTGSRGG
jgi:acyl dehydratase